jgi:hypothetical protein
MVPAIEKYRSCIDVEADLHNGGTPFIRYFFYEAVVSEGNVSIHKYYVKPDNELSVVERVEESYGLLLNHNNEKIFKVDLVSTYNPKYIVSSYVIYEGNDLIIVDTSDNEARLLRREHKKIKGSE